MLFSSGPNSTSAYYFLTLALIFVFFMLCVFCVSYPKSFMEKGWIKTSKHIVIN